jgi:RND family efflux transporter MFP subunit
VKTSQTEILSRWIPASRGVRVLGAALWISLALDRAALSAPPEEKAPNVAVVRVVRQNLVSEVTFTSEFRPYQEVELHAKVSGYLTSISVDFGDQVTEGQQIAELEVPELEDDLKSGQAELEKDRQEVARAEANAGDTHVISSRLVSADKSQPHLLPQQDLDTAAARDLAAQAALGAAKFAVRQSEARVGRLQTMVKYSRITAPFAGIITKRYVDPGALIQAGTTSSSQAVPLVRLSELKRLRFDMVVSIDFVSKIRVGDPVEIVFNSGKRMTVKISRFTHRVEMDTRNMVAEADIDNSDLSIIPGVFAKAILRPDQRANALSVPLQAVAGDDKPTVLRVTKQNELEEVPIKTGLETPSMIEVTDGLNEGDLVMIGSRDRVSAGMKVHPKTVELGGGK